MRYQSWFINDFITQMSPYFDEIITLGDLYLLLNKNISHEKELFSPINKSIEFELSQIKHYMSLDIDENNDILLHMDLSFPGLFHNVLYHKRPKKCFCYCHATSLNIMDLFEKDRTSKWLTELGNLLIYDKVFIGTNYHKYKLMGECEEEDWSNLSEKIEVVGLPIPPFETFKEDKIYDIISVARPCPQKVDAELEKCIEDKFGPIVRKECNTWEEYYKFLSQGKILLISANEETFGYPVMEAIMNNTVVLAPDRCSYPELLSSQFIYRSELDLIAKLSLILKNYDRGEFPKLKCFDLCSNFYENIAQIMKA
jgi:glycosyltransferase involved in cell wall biosynthesis